MARKRVMSVEEIQARNALKEQGLNPDSAAETLQLRMHVKELEDKLKQLEEKPKTTNDIRKSLDALLSHYQVEPAEELIKMATETDANGNPTMRQDDRARIWETLLQYRMPKLKATEISGTVDHKITIQVLDFRSREVLETNTIDVTPELSNG